MRLTGVWVVLALVGCSEGSDPFCQPLGGTGEVPAQSPTVQVEQAAQAFDGDLATAAEFYSVAGAGSVQFSGRGGNTTARSAGVLLVLPPGQVTQVSVQLLRGGEVVASGDAGTQTDISTDCNGDCQQRDGQSYLGINADAAFDEIRASVQVSGTTADTLVYELCHR